MIFFQKALRNIRAYKYKSMLTIVICLFVVLLIYLYMGNLYSIKRQLFELPDAILVSAKITNLNGSQEVNLDIKDDLVQDLQASKYVKNEVFTVRLKAGIGKFPEDEWQKYLKLWVLGANSFQAVSNLKKDTIVWENGESDSFLLGNELKCLVSKELMERYNWKIGDKIPLCQYYYSHGKNTEVFLNPLDTYLYEIVGYMGMSVSSSNVQPPDIILPFETVRNIYLECKVPFFADSASFYVENPLNLNEFKDEMQQLGLVEVVPLGKFSYDGYALSVNDSTFINAANRLRQGEDLLIRFFPFILSIIIGIGYITSFLLLQGRRVEIALLHSIGISKRQCFILIFLEYIILTCMGIVPGSILSAIFHITTIRVILVSGVCVVLCYLFGCCIALWKIQQVSVMDALAQID